MALEPVRRRHASPSSSPACRCTPRLWQAKVGRIALYLLDTDIDENDDVDRLRHATASTAAASRSASARRSCSASAACGRCEALGKQPQVFHMNEGHAGFLALERIRRC